MKTFFLVILTLTFSISVFAQSDNEFQADLSKTTQRMQQEYSVGIPLAVVGYGAELGGGVYMFSQVTTAGSNANQFTTGLFVGLGTMMVGAVLTVIGSLEWSSADSKNKTINYLNTHKALANNIKMAILHHHVLLGMDADELHASVGLPFDVNTNENNQNLTDQLVYSWGYVYLKNGVVEDVQHSDNSWMNN